MTDPSRRRVTKPGGGERERVVALWKMSGVEGVPDEVERECLRVLIRTAATGFNDEIGAVLRADVRLYEAHAPARGGDGFAALDDRQILLSYAPSDEKAAALVEDAFHAENVASESLGLRHIGDVEWEDTKPFPTIVVRSEVGSILKFTDFAREAGDAFYEALAVTVEVEWGIERNEHVAARRLTERQQVLERRQHGVNEMKSGCALMGAGLGLVLIGLFIAFIFVLLAALLG